MTRAYKFNALAFILDGILLIIALLCDWDSMPLIAICTGICLANWINAIDKKHGDEHADKTANS